MDTEKLIFIALALVFTIISMFVKSKKQKQSLSQDEKMDYDFHQESDQFENSEIEIIFEQNNASNLQKNYRIVSKKSKKEQKIEKIEKIEKKIFQQENVENSLQNTDLENEIALLEAFEGTELQKAFLFSEILKNAKN